MALKKYFPDVRFGANKVSPDEMNHYVDYYIMYPSVSNTLVGTAAGGTAGQAKALVITNKQLDYPRTLLASVVGTADMGGVWVVNGKDQFGKVIQETFTIGTAAAGTPAGSAAGTKVFAEVTSGTFTVDANASGAGSARLGVGTVGTLSLWGLPVKIASTADVKSITWIDNGTWKTVNGGTIGSYIGTANHTFRGTSGIAATDVYRVRVLSTFNDEYQDNYK